ncbi:MAG: NAD-dependent dehydratase [Pseudonocardiales bacterium]|nr:MAG: NAD-dependent dehydratase [Pseudonocardiales bacterium]
MRILVTGGAGFIGSHIVDALTDRGHDVVAFDLLLPAAHPVYDDGGPGYLRHPLTVGDVRDADALDQELSTVDAVCHQAAMVGLGVSVADLPAYTSHNALGTAELLAGMGRAGVNRLVLASSMVVYGEGRYDCAEHGTVVPGPRVEADLAAHRFEPHCPVCGRDVVAGLVTEEAAPDPRNAYAATKLAQEHLSSSWARMTGGTVLALRYHNVYGARMPRDTPYAGVAAVFRSALERCEAPQVFEDGDQRRDFVDVRDIAAANVLALELATAPGGLRAYNICSGEPHTIGELAAELSRSSGGPRPVVTGDYRLGDVRHVAASADRARNELGFSAGIRFAHGVADFATAPLRG